MSSQKAVALLALLIVAEARFGVEQEPVAAIQALDGVFGEGGAAATIAGSVPGSLLAAASPCEKLSLADQMITELGDDQEVVDAALGLVAAETNFNPFAVDVPFVCADPALPASEQLRGVTPLVDPDVTDADIANAASEQSITTPFDAEGLSQAEVMIAQGFTQFQAVDANGENIVLAGQDGAGAGAGADAGNDADAGADDAADADADEAEEAVGEDAEDEVEDDVLECGGNANPGNGNGNQNENENGNGAADGADNGMDDGMGNGIDSGMNNGNGTVDGGANNGQNNGMVDEDQNDNQNDDQDQEQDADNNQDQDNVADDNQDDGNNQDQDNVADDNQDAGDDAENVDAGNGGDLDFGICQPTMAFIGGLNGRPDDEFTFIPQDPLIAEGQSEALNPNIITNRICDQVSSSCDANEAAIAACVDAQAQIEALDTRDQSTADTWNALLGFAGADTEAISV